MNGSASFNGPGTGNANWVALMATGTRLMDCPLCQQPDHQADNRFRKIAGVLVAFLIMPPFAWKLAADDKKPIPDYYPLKVGMKWHDRAIDSEGHVTSRIVYQITKNERITGENLARPECSVEGRTHASEHMGSNPMGMYRHCYNGKQVSTPICFLKYPVKSKEMWETRWRQNQGNLPSRPCGG